MRSYIRSVSTSLCPQSPTLQPSRPYPSRSDLPLYRLSLLFVCLSLFLLPLMLQCSTSVRSLLASIRVRPADNWSGRVHPHVRVYPQTPKFIITMLCTYSDYRRCYAGDDYDVYIMTVYIMIMIDAVLSNLVSINQSITTFNFSRTE